jgi:putative transcriptional regulator
MRRWLLLLAWIAGPALAQPNGILLIAKPGLPDPNFSETVVLIARTDDAATVGVILNRPTVRRLVDVAPSWPGAEDFTEPLYHGGPVMREVLVAVFVSEQTPKGAAFRVLPNVYLSMHPANLEPLIAQAGARMRLYAGFSGWAPRQLEAEMQSGSWYVLRATEELIFRKDTTGMWSELVERARGSRTGREPATRVAAR